MSEHYAFQEWLKSGGESERLKLYALVDGIQYDRFFSEPLKDDKGTRSLFRLPEDRALAFAGPWLMDISALPPENHRKIVQLEKKYPAVSWVISEQPFLNLAQHLESFLMISLPSGQTGLFRFYDCRVLKMIPEFLSSEQMANLMKYCRRWLFLRDRKINCYQYDAGSLSVCIPEGGIDSREIL